MKIYNVSNYSKCGSYFGSYLQFVLIVASNEDEALKLAIEKCDFERHKNFEVWQQSNIEVGSDHKGTIIYTHEDYDY